MESGIGEKIIGEEAVIEVKSRLRDGNKNLDVTIKGIVKGADAIIYDIEEGVKRTEDAWQYLTNMDDAVHRIVLRDGTEIYRNDAVPERYKNHKPPVRDMKKIMEQGEWKVPIGPNRYEFESDAS